MSGERLRTFVCFGGLVREMDPEYALALAEQARKERKPMPIAVKTVGLNSAVRLYAVMEHEGREHEGREAAVYRPTIAMVTTQARRMAEASIWVSAVHAFIALGIVAQKAGALVIERPPVAPEPTTMRPSMLRPTMNPSNPLLALAQPVDFDTFFGKAESDESGELPS